jgi:hypothetical protein
LSSSAIVVDVVVVDDDDDDDDDDGAACFASLSSILRENVIQKYYEQHDRYATHRTVRVLRTLFSFEIFDLRIPPVSAVFAIIFHPLAAEKTRQISLAAKNRPPNQGFPRAESAA